MDKNPLDIVRQRQESQLQSSLAFERSFERDSVQRSISFYSTTSQRFQQHLRDNDYPHAYIREFDGQSYLAYSLYSTYSVEGESFYQGQPVTLLVDEWQRFSYIHETNPAPLDRSDRYEKKYPPVRFAMPETLEQYAPERYPNVGMTNTSRNGQEMLRWASHMIQNIERFKQFGHNNSFETYASDAVHTVDEIYEAVRKHVFPDGATSYQRKRFQEKSISRS